VIFGFIEFVSFNDSKLIMNKKMRGTIGGLSEACGGFNPENERGD
jgi:hypothetical protein